MIDTGEGEERTTPVATAFVQKATEGTSLLRVELELEIRRAIGIIEEKGRLRTSYARMYIAAVCCTHTH